MFISLFQCLPSSEQLTVWTDVLPPGPPQIVSLTCQSGSTMFLRWVRPEMFHRTVDVYTVSTGSSLKHDNKDRARNEPSRSLKFHSHKEAP